MNKLFQKAIFAALIFSGFTLTAQNVGINATGAAPSGDALLDISSPNKGLLIPRVSIPNLTLIGPITGGATTSLLVYNTNAATGLGYHYWDGADWIPFLTGNSVDNGLYFNAGAAKVRLGGPLVENTTVTQGGFQMTYNLNGTGDFNVQDNGITRFTVQDNGRVEMSYTLDASGAANTGVLEIANSLRLDGNEVITNTNTALYLNNDNNGDVIIDAGTFNVDASINVIGLSGMPAAPYVLGAGIPVHTVAYPIEIGSDGGAGQQIGIGYYRGADPQMNPEQNGGWGYVGYNVAAAGEYWWRMYAGGFIVSSTRDIKRNINTVNQNDQVEDYLMNSIMSLKPSLYNYYNEYDEMKPGLENHYRPAFRLGLIVDETPDYLLDEGFSGVDIYALATLSLAGVQRNMKEIENLKGTTGTVQDFGSQNLTNQEMWISYTEDFNGTIPVVTVTSNNPNVVLSVVEKSATGFKVVASETASNLSFDWMAMAKVQNANNSKTITELPANLKNKLEVPAATKTQILDFYSTFKSTLTPNGK